MNRYTIRDFKYESGSPMSRLQELENKVEDIAILNGYISVSDFYTDHPLISELKKKYTECQNG